MEIALHALVGFFFGCRLRCRRHQFDDDHLVSGRAAGKSPGSQPQLLPRLGSGRHRQLHGSFERGNRDLRTQSRLPGGERQFDLNVLADHLIEMVRAQPDSKNQRAAPADAGDAQRLAFGDAGRNLHIDLTLAAWYRQTPPPR
jgi:hypothetical protein